MACLSHLGCYALVLGSFLQRQTCVCRVQLAFRHISTRICGTNPALANALVLAESTRWRQYPYSESVSSETPSLPPLVLAADSDSAVVIRLFKRADIADPSFRDDGFMSDSFQLSVGCDDDQDFKFQLARVCIHGEYLCHARAFALTLADPDLHATSLSLDRAVRDAREYAQEWVADAEECIAQGVKIDGWEALPEDDYFEDCMSEERFFDMLGTLEGMARDKTHVMVLVAVCCE